MNTPPQDNFRKTPVGQRAAVICGLLLVATLATAAQPKSSRIFHAGAATSNITPPLGYPLDGFIAQGAPARHVQDELHARCLVLDDGTTRIALVVVDNTMIAREVFERAKQRVETEIGFPAHRILASATHTHSTPRAANLTGAKHEMEYQEFLSRRMGDGIRRAVNNLAPARVGWGAGSKPEFVFNRRWLLKPGVNLPNPFGETSDRVMMNPRAGSPDMAGPAGPVDPQIFVLSVQHADGRPIAVLANYGLHYVGGTGGGTISADYFGAFADQLQRLIAPSMQDPPFVGIMSNGTSGDVNNVDFSKPTRPNLPPYQRIREVAECVAAEVQRVYQRIEHREWVPLAMEESELELAVRRPTPERLAWASQVWSAAAKDARLINRREVYARETLEVAKFPATVPVKLQAIRIGTLGITAVPCEVFASTGLEIKAKSPLRETFTISLANGYNGYLPTPRDHALGGYETWLARSAYLEVEASEKIQAELLRLLAKVGGGSL